MSDYTPPELTDPPDEDDHVMGSPEAPITIVEYGDYQCPHCGYLNQIIREIVDELGSNIYYVFRHFPISTIHPQAQLAAEAAEAADAQGKFWEMHHLLFDRQRDLSIDALVQYAEELGMDAVQFKKDLEEHTFEKKVKDEFRTGVASGVNGTPTLFINGIRYDGAWDLQSIREMVQEPVGIKIQKLAKRFTELAVSGGILLFLFTIIALIWANSPLSEQYIELWDRDFRLVVGNFTLEKHLEGIINDGLMTIFFFVVGLEIKREILIGELSSRRKAFLPIFAAIGGMLVPAVFYISLNAGDPNAIRGWGIPVATDIAFMLVILSFLDNRVPISMRVFFSALAIVDDIGAILIISVVYTTDLEAFYLLYALGILVILVLLNRFRIYSSIPYVILGIVMWYFVFISGVHPTIAGVLLAMTIPSRPDPDTNALIAQCTNLQYEYEISPISAENRKQAVVQTLETITVRLQSPAQKLEHEVQPWTTYLILPLFALSNAGLFLGDVNVSSLANPVTLGIILGLVLGKPIGIVLFSWMAVRLEIAMLPSQVTWKEFFSVSWLTGIGFTMSLFISSIAFDDPAIQNAAKLGILLASMLAAIIGLSLSYFSTRKIGIQQSSFVQKLL